MNKRVYREKTHELIVDPKLVVAWLLGAVLLLAAIWIVQNLQLTIGVPSQNYFATLIIALLLVLVAGLLWIAVAVSTRHEF